MNMLARPAALLATTPLDILDLLDLRLSAAIEVAQAGFHFEEGGCLGMAKALYNALAKRGLPATVYTDETVFTHAYVVSGLDAYDHRGRVALAPGAVPVRAEELPAIALRNGLNLEQFQSDEAWASEIIDSVLQDLHVQPRTEGNPDSTRWFAFPPALRTTQAPTLATSTRSEVLLQRAAAEGRRHGPAVLPWDDKYAVVLNGFVVCADLSQEEAKAETGTVDARFWEGEIANGHLVRWVAPPVSGSEFRPGATWHNPTLPRGLDLPEATAEEQSVTQAPRKLYHGTRKDITQFSVDRQGTVSTMFGDEHVRRVGIFLTPDPGLASVFALQSQDQEGATVMPLYANIKRPLDMLDGSYSNSLFQAVEAAAIKRGLPGYATARQLGDFWGGQTWQMFDECPTNNPESWIQLLNDLGYDSVRMYEQPPEGSTGSGESFVVFRPKQVKSATGNNGSFAPNDPDIRHSIPAVAQTSKTTNTPAFKEWFGNSKVAGADGKPLTVYHGAALSENEDTDIFKGTRKPERNLLSKVAGFPAIGSFFSESARNADSFPAVWVEGKTKRIYPVYLAVQNPKTYATLGKALDDFRNTYHGDPQRYVHELTAQGFDGVSFKEGPSYAGKKRALQAQVWVPFDAAQIKSAIDYKETFSQNMADLQYSFAGQRAATASISRLTYAKERIAHGESPATTREVTGWHKGVDQKWRFEISDNQARLMPGIESLHEGGYLARQVASVTYRVNLDGTYDLRLNPPNPTRTTDFVNIHAADLEVLDAVLPEDAYARVMMGDGDEDFIGADLHEAKSFDHSFVFDTFNALPLSKVLDHPALFAAYPALKEVMVNVDPRLANGGALSLSGTERVITLGTCLQLSVLMHEIQHIIQSIEDFAAGSVPERIGWTAYQRAAGEVEARNTARRLGLTEAQRVDIPPFETADIPEHEQIVSFDQFGCAHQHADSHVLRVKTAIAELLGTDALGLPAGRGQLEIFASNAVPGGWSPLTTSMSRIASYCPSGTADPEVTRAIALALHRNCQAFYDPITQTTGLVADRIPPGQEVAVFLHEMTHKYGRNALVVDDNYSGRLTTTMLAG